MSELQGLMNQVLDSTGTRLRVTDSAGTSAALTDRSGTITTGGTAQTAAAAQTTRVYLIIQNISDTDMYTSTTGTASAGAGSILLKAGGGSIVYENSFIPSGAVSIFCATTGKAFTCKEAI